MLLFGYEKLLFEVNDLEIQFVIYIKLFIFTVEMNIEQFFISVEYLKLKKKMTSFYKLL